jgi:hypothetical protein
LAGRSTPRGARGVGSSPPPSAEDARKPSPTGRSATDPVADGAPPPPLPLAPPGWPLASTTPSSSSSSSRPPSASQASGASSTMPSTAALTLTLPLPRERARERDETATGGDCGRPEPARCKGPSAPPPSPTPPLSARRCRLDARLAAAWSPCPGTAARGRCRKDATRWNTVLAVRPMPDNRRPLPDADRAREVVPPAASSRAASMWADASKDAVATAFPPWPAETDRDSAGGPPPGDDNGAGAAARLRDSNALHSDADKAPVDASEEMRSGDTSAHRTPASIGRSKARAECAAASGTGEAGDGGLAGSARTGAMGGPPPRPSQPTLCVGSSASASLPPAAPGTPMPSPRVSELAPMSTTARRKAARPAGDEAGASGRRADVRDGMPSVETGVAAAGGSALPVDAAQRRKAFTTSPSRMHQSLMERSRRTASRGRAAQPSHRAASCP